ncbi:hypothetical protein Bcav_0050 [Beutenbergia cavernae DSM 12333]|uniref:Lipoprotein n=1 Tax=Beutenbergia cavernae (strain ATCC BAA-8 / DSM 12333 / CCUG 43141 / JCM 11478 / NBRC 16432 / NCIMB 13614 / HKI 0122) TaxID=471853 RepID=C5BUU2_BEUC1|nr:hypothetical protein [Beutenbergia cavernae]ACQ78316.1 hypothetical protein Bcav_0050 [Beutenbergia cavernae DSM 12333]
MVPRRAAALACALAASLAAAACTPPAPFPHEALDGLSVEVYQGRIDWGERVIELRITNDGEVPLVVTGANLEAPITAQNEPKTADRTVALRPGITRAMYVRLGVPLCGEIGDGGAHAVLDVETEDGLAARVEVPAADPDGYLDRAHSEDCAEQAFAAGATATFGDDVRIEERDGHLVGGLELTVVPVPGGPEVSVAEVGGTQLLAPLGGPVWSDPALLDLPDDGARVTLWFTAVRCDQHAYADDKRGKFVPIRSVVDGVAEDLFYVHLPQATRRSLGEYFALACGWDVDLG